MSRRFTPRGAITRASCRRMMASRAPRSPRKASRGSPRPRSVGITSAQCAQACGRRMMRTPGLKMGKFSQLTPGTNLKVYSQVMRGAGYAIKVSDLRKMQR